MKPENKKNYPVEQTMQLLPFLLKTLSNHGRNAVKSILARGQVSVDGQVTTAYNFPLHIGQLVSISMGFVPPVVRMQGLSILHEDDSLVVVVKEAGLLSIAAGDMKEQTAYRQLMDHVQRSNHNHRVFIIHRLDRDTSGVMMFAKTEQAKLIMQNQWKERLHERTYVALVEGKVVEKEGRIESWLKETATLKMYSSPRPNGGQHAVTHYQVMKSNRDFSLLSVQLETGRKNQIRVHMQDIGHPIVGDAKYGATKNMIGRLGLHAHILAFSHPMTNQPMRFEAVIPSSFDRPFH